MANELSRYCLHCGGNCSSILIEGRLRQKCVLCGTIFYDQWKVSAGVRITQNEKLLLVQRAHQPWKDCWHMPAGYVETDEDPAAAAVRETLEETGLSVRIRKLVDIYTDFEDPRGNVLVIIFDADILEGLPIITSETVAIKYFSPEEIQDLEFAGMSARKEIEAWLSEIAKEATIDHD